MNKTYVIFEKATMRAVGYVMLEETLFHLAIQPDQVAAELPEGVYEPKSTYAIVDGKAVKQ